MPHTSCIFMPGIGIQVVEFPCTVCLYGNGRVRPAWRKDELTLPAVVRTTAAWLLSCC